MDPVKSDRILVDESSRRLGVISGGRPAHSQGVGVHDALRCADAVLLTGATGFVGGELLLRLLARDDRRVLCLVRGASERDAQRRGQDRLRALLGRAPQPQEERRVEWIQADLEQSRMGLTPFAFIRIAARVSEIFHCAASVDFDLPLEQAQRINVDPVRDLLALARMAGRSFRRFHHVSTAYVSGRVRKRVDADHLPLDRAANFRNTYERTKARAERLLRGQDDIEVSIYRPSIIAGETLTGRTDSWNVLYAPMRQIMKGRLPFLCRGGKAIVDTVAVDFVVDGIVALAARPAAGHQAYHLTADRLAFDVERYVQACNRAARSRGLSAQTRSVGRLSWTLRATLARSLAWAPRGLGRLRQIGQAARRGLACFRPYLAYTMVEVEFEAEKEHRLLRAAGIRMPDPDIYLERVIGYALDSDFGRIPATPRPMAALPDAGPSRSQREPVSAAAASA